MFQLNVGKLTTIKPDERPKQLDSRGTHTRIQPLLSNSVRHDSYSESKNKGVGELDREERRFSFSETGEFLPSRSISATARNQRTRTWGESRRRNMERICCKPGSIGF